MLSVIAVAVLGIAGLLLVFVIPTGEGLPLAFEPPVETHNNLYLVITTARAVGFALLWLATLTAVALAGRSSTPHFGSTAMRVGLYVAALGATAGALLVFVLPSGGGISLDFGSFKEGGGLPALFFLTRERAFGLVLMWVSSLFVAVAIAQPSEKTRTRA